MKSQPIAFHQLKFSSCFLLLSSLKVFPAGNSFHIVLLQNLLNHMWQAPVATFKNQPSFFMFYKLNIAKRNLT